MKAVQLFEAFDGQRFDSADACKAHEDEHMESRLVNLTLEQVRAGISREDVGLADAIEKLGSRIGKTRRDGGERRRKVADGAPEPAAAAKTASLDLG